MPKKKNLKSIEQSMEENSNNSLNAKNGFKEVGNAGKQKAIQNQR